MFFAEGERVRVNITRHQHNREFLTGDTGHVVRPNTSGEGYCMVKLDVERIRTDGRTTHELKDIWAFNLVSLCPRKVTNGTA